MADTIQNPGNITKQDLISALVQKELQFAAKLLPTITNVSQFAVKGAKSISFPKLTSFTVANRAFGAAGDATALTETADKLDLNINAYVAWLVDESSAIQSTINWQLEAAKRAASAMGRYVDNQIITELVAAGVPVSTPGNISYANVIEMVEKLRKADADMSKVVLLVSPAQHSILMGLDEFKRADVYGSANIPGGVIGFILGVPVMIHNGLSDAQYLMYEQSSCAIGFQLGANMSEQGANEYGALSKRVAVDQLFGVQALQLDEKDASATQSPLIRIYA